MFRVCSPNDGFKNTASGTVKKVTFSKSQKMMNQKNKNIPYHYTNWLCPHYLQCSIVSNSYQVFQDFVY